MKTIFSRRTELNYLREIAEVYLKENKIIKNLKTPAWIDSSTDNNITKLKTIKAKLNYFKGDKEIRNYLSRANSGVLGSINANEISRWILQDILACSPENSVLYDTNWMDFLSSNDRKKLISPKSSKSFMISSIKNKSKYLSNEIIEFYRGQNIDTNALKMIGNISLLIKKKDFLGSSILIISFIEFVIRDS